MVMVGDHSDMGSQDGGVSWPAVCGNGSDRAIFWDPEAIFNSTEPDLPVCFQQTVLVWVPCGFLWFCLPFYTAYLCSRRQHYAPCNKTKLNIIKLVLAVLLIGVSLAEFIKTFVDSSVEYQPSLAAYLDPGIRSLSFVVAAAYIHWQFSVGVHTSGVFFCFWFLLTVCGIIPFRTKILDVQHTGVIEDVFRFAIFYVYYGLVVVMFVLEAFFADIRVLPLKRSTDERTPLLAKEEPEIQTTNGYSPCPEVTATFLSNITHWWITKLLINGYRKPIVFGDMTDILDRDRSKTVFAEFNKAWEKQVETKDNPSLLNALVYTCRWDIIMAATFRFLACVFEFSNPILLQAVIGWVSGKDPFVWKGYALAVVLLLANVLNAIIYHIFFKYSYITAMRVRTAIIASVYRKALKLSSAARRHTTVGEIVNLMSVDAQKLHDVAFDVHEVWAGPLMVIIAMYLLWGVIGPSSMAGLGFLLILAPINGGVFARKFAQIQAVQMKYKDNRIKLTNELLNGIKVLKMYAWEPSFAASIKDVRHDELQCVRSQALISTGVGVSWFCAPFMVPLAVFAVYVLSSPDNYLDPTKAFVTISLIGTLSWAVAFLPIFIAFAAQAYVSINRIIGMLLQDEIDPDAIDHDQAAKNAIEMRHGTYTWDQDGDNGPVLKDITLDVPEGSLVGVVGTVGAGKSSLVAAMLGELQAVHGVINVKGSLAYVPQQAWIQNATAKDNILFGKRLKADKYKRIIDACALTADFEILPAGDMTEIGEKGINLSGGQKQRVSLARAVYQNEDIYLLDDPLSAVDAHVGKHIFDKVIGPEGILKHTTRVLVTHGLVHLPRCDVIIVMKDGEVSECGTYQELLIRDEAFAEYLRQYLHEVTDADDLEVDPDLKSAVQELERQLSTLSEGTASSRHDSGGEEATTLRKRKVTAKRALSRAASVVEEEDEEKRKDVKKDILVEEEAAAIGTIKWAVIKDYVEAGTLRALVALVLCCALFVAAQVTSNIWLSAWSDDPILNVTEGRAQTNVRLGVYGGLGALQVLGIFGLSLAIFLGGVEASKKLHARLLDRIIRAPMAFFDTTPIGRIINRFSTDMDKLDNNIPMFVRWWLVNLVSVVSTIVVISYSTPLFLIVVVPLGILYYIIQRVYIASVRQMKRIDSIRKTPIYVNFDESLVGVACVRAFNREEQFIDRNDKFVDDNTRAWYPILIAQRWLGFFLDTMGGFVVFFAALFAVLTRDTITGGLVGLSVSFAMQTTWTINMMVRGATDLETHVVSAERIKEYSEVETEAEWEIDEQEPQDGWPLDGVIQFKDFSTRYRPGLDLVLKDLNFRVGGGEKVGVVGRTGAGKSSMTLSLFRIIESAVGRIEIDAVDISSMGLHDLRSRLTIIPQDPVLFAGTMRRNLDPFEVYTDDEIWTALEHAHLKAFVTGLTAGLQYEVGEGGQALSVGQRQLLCLARALLRKSQILVLDEATAAVDLETDDLIQTTIRKAFKDCTVMTIAHRLNTVMDYDRVMVLDQGQIKEFDSPSRLLEDKNTIFHGMAKDASIV